jgi:hypothetical protein
MDVERRRGRNEGEQRDFVADDIWDTVASVTRLRQMACVLFPFMVLRYLFCDVMVVSDALVSCKQAALQVGGLIANIMLLMTERAE